MTPMNRTLLPLVALALLASGCRTQAPGFLFPKKIEGNEVSRPPVANEELTSGQGQSDLNSGLEPALYLDPLKEIRPDDPRGTLASEMRTRDADGLYDLAEARLGNGELRAAQRLASECLARAAGRHERAAALMDTIDAKLRARGLDPHAPFGDAKGEALAKLKEHHRLMRERVRYGAEALEAGDPEQAVTHYETARDHLAYLPSTPYRFDWSFRLSTLLQDCHWRVQLQDFPQ